MRFSEYLNQQNYIAPKPKAKMWHASKQDILDLWQRANPNQPIPVQPVPAIHKGPRYDMDGVRITGRGEFINAVLGRIKDLLRYENAPGTKLDVEYRQVASPATDQFGMNKYATYIYVVEDRPKPKKP